MMRSSVVLPQPGRAGHQLAAVDVQVDVVQGLEAVEALADITTSIDMNHSSAALRAGG
jgi:hypothetical protein